MYTKWERDRCPRNEGRRGWPSEPYAREKSNKLGMDEEEREFSRGGRSQTAVGWLQKFRL